MQVLGKFTREETLSQLPGWQEAYRVVQQESAALAQVARTRSDRPILFTGCGSTYYLSLAAAAHLRRLTRWPALGLPGSELWLDPSYLTPDDILVAISRSGTTTETLRAVDRFHAVTGKWPITIQVTPGVTLASRGSPSLIMPSASEQSITQTRSFAAMLVAAESMNALLAGRADVLSQMARLTDVGPKVLEGAQRLAREWGSRLDLDRIYFLGSGPRYALACEGSLKMKEMSLSHAEPFHFLEFRHGPKSMVTDSTLVVGLISDQTRQEELQVLDEMAALGGHIVTMGEEVNSIGDGGALSFASSLDEAARDVLYLPFLQLLALERAVAKRLDPDLPRNLDAVVELDRA